MLLFQSGQKYPPKKSVHVLPGWGHVTPTETCIEIGHMMRMKWWWRNEPSWLVLEHGQLIGPRGPKGVLSSTRTTWWIHLHRLMTPHLKLCVLLWTQRRRSLPVRGGDAVAWWQWSSLLQEGFMTSSLGWSSATAAGGWTLDFSAPWKQHRDRNNSVFQTERHGAPSLVAEQAQHHLLWTSPFLPIVSWPCTDKECESERCRKN